MIASFRHILLPIIIIALCGLGAFYALGIKRTDRQSVETRISRENVQRVSIATGKVVAESEATLKFQVRGELSEIRVKEGDQVASGTVIAMLSVGELEAERKALEASVKYYTESKKDLISGRVSEAQSLSRTTIEIAEENYNKVKEKYDTLIKNAYNVFLNTDIQAYPVNFTNEKSPPILSGTYTCSREGVYVLETYASDASGGYSFRASGLEQGTFEAWTDTAGALGQCGLYIQFAEGEKYGSTKWEIHIPNKRSSNYANAYNVYMALLKERDVVLTGALQQITSAKATQIFEDADPSVMSVAKAGSQIEQAQSLLFQIDERIKNYSIKAPFDGIIADINMEVGETVDDSKFVSMVGGSNFTIEARVPEFAVRPLRIGDVVRMSFDAAPQETVFGLVDYISPKASPIGSVAYYDTRIKFIDHPAWLRDGLTADIEIVHESRTGVLAVPKQFIFYEDDVAYVYVYEHGKHIKNEAHIGLEGTDGLVEILNIPEHTVVMMP